MYDSPKYIYQLRKEENAAPGKASNDAKLHEVLGDLPHGTVARLRGL